MTRLERNVNIAAVVIPFLGVIAAGALLWNRFLGWREVAIFAVMYVLTALGVTVGFHRLLTHRAFQTRPWLRYTLAILGSMSLQGPVIDWVADHRKHHTFTDEEGDPHSPHAGHGAGLRGMVAGLWHAHVGWLFETHGQASSKRFARDLVEDPVMRRINKSFPLLALAQPRAALPRGRCAQRRLARRRRTQRPAVGRPRADLPRASHHLEHQLHLPLLRQPPLRHRRSVDERELLGLDGGRWICLD